MIAVRVVVAGLVLAALACGASGVTPPVAWASGTYACSSCRMTVVDRHFASQLVTPGEEPRVFDDMGCLASYLAKQPAVAGAVVYVSDHRTGDWVPATDAVYTRVESLRAPMGSHIVAHRDRASRDADPQAAGGSVVEIREVFSAGLPGVPR